MGECKVPRERRGIKGNAREYRGMLVNARETYGSLKCQGNAGE